jgi:hypothetical protein
MTEGNAGQTMINTGVRREQGCARFWKSAQGRLLAQMIGGGAG